MRLTELKKGIPLPKIALTAVAPFCLIVIIPSLYVYSAYLKITLRSNFYIFLDIILPILYAIVLISSIISIIHTTPKGNAVKLSCMCTLESIAFAIILYLLTTTSSEIIGIIPLDARLPLIALTSYFLTVLYCALMVRRI